MAFGVAAGGGGAHVGGMGAPNHAPVSDPRFAVAAVPWWVRLSRWLNGARVCSVGDCIEFTEPAEHHCTSHIRSFRSRLGEHRCAAPRCVQARGTGDHLCPHHREVALIDLGAAPAAVGLWNTAGAGPPPGGR
ncbi:hypothetical protein GCM10027570_33260 [Streptomonospora sediminis]